MQTERLVDRVLQRVYVLLNRHDVIPDGIQEQMLISHVRVMAHRSISDELLPEVDANPFEEISPDPMTLACGMVVQFGSLLDEEARLLSVHFEIAKENL